MFGHHANKRATKRANRKSEDLKREKSEWKSEAPAREAKSEADRELKVGEKVAKAESRRSTATEKGRADLENFLSKDIEGLDPEKRKVMEFEENRKNKNSYQSANRKLLGEQAQRGIRGQGGVGYAQQMDLQREAKDSQNQISRDMTKLDRDLAIKKLAAIYAGGQGEAGQALLDQQAAEDELDLAKALKKNKKDEDKYNKSFSRI